MADDIRTQGPAPKPAKIMLSLLAQQYGLTPEDCAEELGCAVRDIRIEPPKTMTQSHDSKPAADELETAGGGVCVWTHVEGSKYATGCGKVWYALGGPANCGVVYCHNCARTVEVKEA